MTAAVYNAYIHYKAAGIIVYNAYLRLKIAGVGFFA
jgi:hypothetical protein